MSVANWLYISISQLSTTEADAEIDFIVATSRRRNPSLGVTGALLHTGGCFVQFLEGPVAGVRILRSDISRDSRHADLVTVRESAAPERRFADWSLAYTGASHLVAKVVEEARRDAADQPARAGETLLRLLAKFSPLG